MLANIRHKDAAWQNLWTQMSPQSLGFTKCVSMNFFSPLVSFVLTYDTTSFLC
jgi:hypothetical protein